ncbi:MAG: glycosyltransferase family 1 protein [Candidatus Peribacteraceae bacterium]|nr:glycosyltransferase family 1 protein [Candidatus Peribacteraceae bacterium]
MPLIGIDCRFASTQSGLGRYTRELVTRMALLAPESFVLFVRSSEEPWLSAVPAKLRRIGAPFRSYGFAEQVSFPGLIRKSGIRLFFCPHFNVPLRCPVPFVATIHDLILHRYPNTRNPFKRIAYRLLMRSTIRHACHLITVSAFAAQEIVSQYGEQFRRKLSIIPEGVSKRFVPQPASAVESVRQKYSLFKLFYLYVGNAKPHKNIHILLDAFRRNPNGRELLLVMSGPEVKQLHLPENVRILSTVPEEDLPALFSAADAFVTATLYEGFCLPVLEALACGCPVIASNRGAIPETVRGTSARLVEPESEQLAHALAHPPARSPLVSPPSWDEAASTTLDLLLAA